MLTVLQKQSRESHQGKDKTRVEEGGDRTARLRILLIIPEDGAVEPGNHLRKALG